MENTWEEIPGFEGRYAVSDAGEIVAIREFGRLPLRQSFDGAGYKKVTLSIRGKRVTRRVHRFVAAAFIPNPEGRAQVNHKNGDKADNRAENLEWVTQQVNNDHALASGLNFKARGERIGTARVTESQVLEIRAKIASGTTNRAICDQYGLHHATVSDIIARRSWRHI